MPNEQNNEIINRLKGLSGLELLNAAQGHFGDSLVFASSMGAEDQVIADMLSRLSVKTRIITLDTGRLAQETYDLIEATEYRYDLKIEVVSPDATRLQDIVQAHGVNMFYKDVELRKLCCLVRKIEPLRRALTGQKAWICGLRREQSITRTDLNAAEWDNQFGLWKISPLLDWTTEQVWSYIKANNVPYNPLHDKGYPSIGCAPCTRAVKPGEDIRAGRWWWENPHQKECGLHGKK